MRASCGAWPEARTRRHPPQWGTPASRGAASRTPRAAGRSSLDPRAPQPPQSRLMGAGVAVVSAHGCRGGRSLDPWRRSSLARRLAMPAAVAVGEPAQVAQCNLCPPARRATRSAVPARDGSGLGMTRVAGSALRRRSAVCCGERAVLRGARCVAGDAPCTRAACPRSPRSRRRSGPPCVPSSARTCRAPHDARPETTPRRASHVLAPPGAGGRPPTLRAGLRVPRERARGQLRRRAAGQVPR